MPLKCLYDIPLKGLMISPLKGLMISHLKAPSEPLNRLQHKRSVMDCQGVQGRARGKARGPEQGGTGASLGPLAVHHTVLMLESV